jgi:hypothetical protein
MNGAIYRGNPTPTSAESCEVGLRWKRDTMREVEDVALVMIAHRYASTMTERDEWDVSTS